MRELSALAYLALITLRRQVWTRRTLLVLGLLSLIWLGGLLWNQRNPQTNAKRTLTGEQLFVEFSEDLVFPIYISFALPIIALLYATAAFSEDRDDRTLVYLLIRPLERYRLYLAKLIGIIPAAVTFSLFGFVVLCLMAGPAGIIALPRFWWPIALSATAYCCLFLAFGALVPRPMIVSVGYAFLGETLLGNMPGTIKRFTISFHTRCLLYSQGADCGLAPDVEQLFLPISASMAYWCLGIGAVAVVAGSAYLFHYKEYPGN